MPALKIGRLYSLLTLCSVGELAAQATRVSTHSARALAPISESFTRAGPRTSLELPFAMSRVTPDSSRPGLRRASVGELLLAIPGVQVQERANPAQDP